MNSNQFELIGRINYLDIKYNEKGSCILRILMSKKGKEENSYNSFPITMFNKTAQDFAETIQKGDSARITGKLGINKYTSKEGKEIEKLELIGNSFAKVKYDETKKEYIQQDEAPTTQTDEEIPW